VEEKPWNNNKALAAAAIAVLAAGAGALFCPKMMSGEGSSPESTEDRDDLSFDMPEIKDSIYDVTDNLAVVVLTNEDPSSTEITLSPETRQRLRKLNNFLRSTPDLQHVRLYYTRQQPSGLKQAKADELRLMMYKGHRKEATTFTDEVPTEFLSSFFVPRSEEPLERREKGMQTISYSQFDKYVLEESFHRPVLLQIYEDTCFLCFLMRPFMERLARMDNMPFSFRRLNVEKNDFPEGLPIARGTPTFVLYESGVGKKWEEYKPADVATKLLSFPDMPVGLKEELDKILPQVQERFMLITGVIMLQIDVETLQKQSFSAEKGESVEGEGTPEKDQTQEKERENKDNFEETVLKVMLEDQQRTDDMADNLSYLRDEAKQLEEDIRILAEMLSVEIPAEARLRKAEAARAEEAKANTAEIAEAAEGAKAEMGTHGDESESSSDTAGNVASGSEESEDNSTSTPVIIERQNDDADKEPDENSTSTPVIIERRDNDNGQVA